MNNWSKNGFSRGHSPNLPFDHVCLHMTLEICSSPIFFSGPSPKKVYIISTSRSDHISLPDLKLAAAAAAKQAFYHPVCSALTHLRNVPWKNKYGSSFSPLLHRRCLSWIWFFFSKRCWSQRSSYVTAVSGETRSVWAAAAVARIRWKAPRAKTKDLQVHYKNCPPFAN